MGRNSIAALLCQRSPDKKDAAADNDDGDGDHNNEFCRDMYSIFGLNIPAPYPLMSPRSVDSLTEEMMSDLPSAREVLRLFTIYKDTVHPFWGFLVDIDAFETRLTAYLEERTSHSRGTVTKWRPVSGSWLAILFGCLAMASQFSDAPYSVRWRDSAKYLQMAVHFLRLSNFLLHPNFDTIQAMLITSFVLINDMKVEASWAVLGLSCRLAISLGLHRPTTDDPDTAQDQKSNEMIRRKLWWTCVWHDTLISSSFDR